MNSAQSIIDDRAVDPHAAQGALDRLSRRYRDGLTWGGTAALVAILFALAGRFDLAGPALTGGIAGLAVALLARSDRQALIVRLVGQRSAYAIPDVARAAQRISTPMVRQTLARSLTRLVLEADGLEPSSPVLFALPDRVSRHSRELLGVAYLLAHESVKVHPASIALLNRLLSSPLRSPLFNPQVPEAHVRMALQRVRAGISVQ
jgi:hypothetical protein